MRLDDIRDVQNLNWRPLSPAEVASLARFWDADDNDSELLDAIEREAWLSDEINRATSGLPALPKDELIYVAIGNATCKDDYLRLMARYGTPANRDLDENSLLAYEALGEAIYRISTLLAYSEGFGEKEDIAEVFHLSAREPHLSMDCPIPASMELSISIPDYRRVILPNEVRVEDINEIYWPPMNDQMAGYPWSTCDKKWHAQNLEKIRNAPGMNTYRLKVHAKEDDIPARFSESELHYFAGALANSVINEQLKDMRLSFRNGEVDLVDLGGAMRPPVWRMVWIALAQAKNKTIPSICRTCGRLVDRRAERRSKTTSCNDNLHKCTSAFHNNGKRRMIKRSEWGRPFKNDATFAYIQEYRDAVLDMLSSQKNDPCWPPFSLRKR